MAQAHDRHVDLQVLEEVERVLASTSFASIDDLAGRLGSTDDANLAVRAPTIRRPTGVLEPVLTPADAGAPLPRRR